MVIAMHNKITITMLFFWCAAVSEIMGAEGGKGVLDAVQQILAVKDAFQELQGVGRAVKDLAQNVGNGGNGANLNLKVVPLGRAFAHLYGKAEVVEGNGPSPYGVKDNAREWNPRDQHHEPGFYKKRKSF